MALKLDLLRPDDLLNLHIECENLRLDKSRPDQPALVPVDPAQPVYLIITFPPQTIAEQAIFESAPTNPPPEDAGKPFNKPPTAPSPAGISARLGGASRLVFRRAANAETRIPYSLAGLLEGQGWELSVAPLADVPEQPTAAQRANAPAIKAPARLETAIELPYRLILSPGHNVVWQHATGLRTRHGRTELWHTRLAQRVGERIVELSRAHTAPLRAIWSPDYNPNKFETSDPPRFGEPDADWGVLSAMTPSDRHEIVILTSAFHGFVNDDSSTYQPRPIHAEQLMLSPLGGWLKSRGNWEPPRPWIPFLRFSGARRWEDYIKLVRLTQRVTQPLTQDLEEQPREEPHALALAPNTSIAVSPVDAVINPALIGRKGASLNVSEWVHVAAQGRDHYVRIVYEGHLYPFGHRAALIKVTERKFRDLAGTPAAIMVQRLFIVVREPRKDYRHAPLEHDGRSLPLVNVRLTTLVTPDIANPFPPKNAPLPAHRIANTDSFWVRLGTGASAADDFKFHALAADIGDHEIDFTASLIFVPLSDSTSAASNVNGETVTRVELVRRAYVKSGAARACPVPGQQVTYAARKANTPDNTTLTTRVLHFTTHDAPPNKQYGGFLPKLFKAEVNIPAVEQLLGTNAPTAIGYYDDYLNNNGFANAGNKNGLFARIVKESAPGQLAADTIKSAFSADKAGGIATPDLSISGITRELGPLAGDLVKAAQDVFDPKDFFKDVADTAKLFGSLKLTDVLTGGSSSGNAPKVEFFTEPIPLGRRLVTTLNWQPKVHDLTFGILNFKTTAATELKINARIEKPIQVGAPDQPARALFKGVLTAFTLDFLNVIVVRFKAFTFTSETGKKTDVNVQLEDDPIKFQGDLAFVEELRNVIPPGLFGDGPSLDITPQHVKAGFSIGLPPVAVGVFALKDVSLGAFIELPFRDGKPVIDFAVSSREHPFNLTVMIFGGGGFFHLQLDTAGMRMLEAALEFGACASIDLGVASGSVHIMAGIYFAMQRRKIDGKDVDAATLSGYLRMGGELSILGLISISLEFMLSFTYEAAPVDKASGRATLTVKVEVLFFSKSVEVTVEKRFGGKSGDPTFAQLWDSADVWSEYAAAFA